MDNPDTQYYTDELANVRSSIADKKYAAAISHLRAAAAVAPALSREAEALDAQFFYMLRFLAADNDMPDLENTLERLAADISDLAFRIGLELEISKGGTLLGGRLRYARMRPEENTQSLVSDYLAELDALSRDTAALTDTRRRSTLERISADIFGRLWTSFPLDTDTVSLLQSIIADSDIPYPDRALWVYGLGLNYLLHNTDIVADMLLAIHSEQDNRLSAIAAVCLVLGGECQAHDFKRRKVRAVLKRLSDAQPSDLRDILLEWCRSLGTEQLGEDFRRLMDGRLGRIGRSFMNRIDSDDPSKAREQLMNPEWLAGDINSSDYEAIRRFNEAQSKGDDVFMASIGKMRHFDFFNAMSNWFLPFHTAHSALAPVVDGEGAAVADMIDKMPMLCDSDKYALLLSMAQAPPSVRDSSMAAMSAQMMSITDTEEFREAIGESGAPARRSVINNIIKNLYRFFTLFGGRAEFRNPLSGDPGQYLLLQLMEVSEEQLHELAMVAFEQKRYTLAEAALTTLHMHFGLSIANRQKLAFSREMTGNITDALRVYRELMSSSPDDMWCALRLATIALELNLSSEAAAVLKPFAGDSDSAELLSLYTEALCRSGSWVDAVDVLHKLDYLLPDGDADVKADLAWALGVTGDFDSASAILADVPDSAAVLRRKAVISWLAGRHSDAVRLREQASRLLKDTPAPDDRLFRTGLEYLRESHPEAASLDMINEILRYRRYGSSFGDII
ncbi:MAG: hypothetical protein NC418_02750 [Muribaculaceae bacterium]|nr:hypothetical protein [Muribaculaceae bacterium]